jgi:hypothetical protein
MEEGGIPPILYASGAVAVAILILAFSVGSGRAMGRLWEKSHLKEHLIHVQRRITEGLSHIRQG